MKATTTLKANKRLPRKSTAGVKPKKMAAQKELKKIPNLFFLGLAGAAVVGSTLLSLSNNGKRKILGQLVGLLVPSLMTLSLYNKVAQVENEVLDVVKH
jgi:GTPase involved in cell partitioning and DNA repair